MADGGSSASRLSGQLKNDRTSVAPYRLRRTLLRRAGACARSGCELPRPLLHELTADHQLQHRHAVYDFAQLVHGIAIHGLQQPVSPDHRVAQGLGDMLQA